MRDEPVQDIHEPVFTVKDATYLGNGTMMAGQRA